MAQVLRRYVLTGDLSVARGVEAIEALRDLPLTRYPHSALVPRVWALRHHLTAYDAAYLALAEALDAVLVTRDAGLASVARASATVELL